MAHLWEADHSYYCAESNFYAPGNGQPRDSYKALGEFIAAYRDSDFDMNLVFRWDWKEGEDHDLAPFTGDVNYRNGKLLIFWMGQRKGLYRWSEVEVCRADEPAVIAFLQPRLDHLMSLWAPLNVALATTTPPASTPVTTAQSPADAPGHEARPTSLSE